MADLRRELEQMRNRIKSLEQKNKQYERTARSLRNISPYQSSLVKADEDILPDEEGKCISMYRMAEGSSPYLKLKQRPVIEFKVYNHRKTPIWKDEEFHVARDVWGDYYRISGFVEASFFLTGDEGIPAASGQFNPQGADCQRYYFNNQPGVIDPVEDPETGGTVFEFVYNHTTNAIAADKVIQAKKIDGQWFIDVEPC
jgi:hypothetical protein